MLFSGRHILVFLLVFASSFLLSQIEKESAGYAEIKLFPSSTIEQTRQKAIDAAKINAIESAFGSVLMEGNSLYTVNKQEGTKAEFNQVFNSISDVFVNGDWIKDLEQPKVERVIKGEEIFYTASVKGIVRELKTNPAKFSIKALSCENKTCETEFFNNGQDFYLYFKAPNTGYMAVYLDIPTEHTTYRLLPYKQESNLGSVYVKADVEYIFFSPKKADPKKIAQVDELEWTLTDKTMPETNKLFVLYRPDVPLEKPILTSSKGGKAKSSTQEKPLEIPLNLKSEDFQVWLQNLRSRNKDIQLMNLYLTIKP